MSRRNTEYIERINGKKWQLYLQWNLHRDEILGNRAISTGFYFIRIFVVASISILFPKEETARLNFQNWDAKDKSVQALVCPFPYFFFFFLSSLSFSPPLFCPLAPSLLPHSSWISFRRELCSYEGVEFLARRRIIRLATKPVESSKLNRNWIGPLHPLAGSSNVDRKSESV